MANSTNVPGMILAGGASRRMGRDKAFVELDGRPMIAHVVAALAPQCGALAVNARLGESRFRALGLPIVPDGDFAGQGPLAGILSALDWAAARGADRVLTVAVDTPFLPCDLARRLSEPAAPIVQAETADGVHGTTAIWSVELRRDLRAALARGLRKVTAWSARHTPALVRFRDGHPPPLFNINTGADLARAEAWLAAPEPRRFDRIVTVDWSARSEPSPVRPAKDAIFVADARAGSVAVRYHRTRSAAVESLRSLFDTALRSGETVLAGFDFPFAYPSGFARALTGRDDPLAVWDWLDAAIEDDARNRNNRFDVAEAINRRFPGTGPFWGCPKHRATPHLPDRGSARHGHGMTERRRVERRVPRAQPCWKLFTTGSVGSQALLGLPRLARLRRRYGEDLAVRPFEARAAPLVLAEIYPSLLSEAVARQTRPDEVRDAAQVRVLAQALARLPADRLEAMLRMGDAEEGWILGVGDEDALRRAADPPA